MAKSLDVCPGCSRHCLRDEVRCKYGQKYFDKRIKADAQHGHEPERRHCKWEKLVGGEGLLFRLLWTGRQVKHALRKGRLTKAHLLKNLDESEQEALYTLLGKILEPVEQREP